MKVLFFLLLSPQVLTIKCWPAYSNPSNLMTGRKLPLRATASPPSFPLPLRLPSKDSPFQLRGHVSSLIKSLEESHSALVLLPSLSPSPFPSLPTSLLSFLPPSLPPSLPSSFITTQNKLELRGQYPSPYT